MYVSLVFVRMNWGMYQNTSLKRGGAGLCFQNQVSILIVIAIIVIKTP